MPHISTDNHFVTLINVFTVDPLDQPRLISLLTQATNDVIKDLPGFISANIHKGHDGTRVINYAQWRSREDFAAMLKVPAAQHHMHSALGIAKADPQLYEVVETIEAGIPAAHGS